jgi:hypothetical protein
MSSRAKSRDLLFDLQPQHWVPHPERSEGWEPHSLRSRTIYENNLPNNPFRFLACGALLSSSMSLG